LRKGSEDFNCSGYFVVTIGGIPMIPYPTKIITKDE
jgi:hypothetical protein